MDFILAAVFLVYGIIKRDTPKKKILSVITFDSNVIKMKHFEQCSFVYFNNNITQLCNPKHY